MKKICWIIITMMAFFTVTHEIMSAPGSFRGKGNFKKGMKEGMDNDMEKLSPEQRETMRKIMEMTQAYERLAKISEDKGNLEKAVSYLEEIIKMSDEAIKNAPESKKDKVIEGSVHIQMRIAMLKSKMGKEDEAEKIMQKLLSENKIPENMLPGVYLRMSKQYEQKGNLDKAEELLLKSIELNKK